MSPQATEYFVGTHVRESELKYRARFSEPPERTLFELSTSVLLKKPKADYEGPTRQRDFNGRERMLQSQADEFPDERPSRTSRPPRRRIRGETLPAIALLGFALLGLAQSQVGTTYIHPVILVPLTLIAAGFAVTAVIHEAIQRREGRKSRHA